MLRVLETRESEHPLHPSLGLQGGAGVEQWGLVLQSGGLCMTYRDRYRVAQPRWHP